MSLIKIINGTFGYRPAGSRSIEPKQAGDPPFDVDEKQAQRLVALGVAALVEEPKIVHLQPVATTLSGEVGSGPSDPLPIGDDGAEGAEATREKPAYNTEMKANELRALMVEHGLKVKPGMSKADMVEALDTHFADDTFDAADDGEAPPTITPEDPVL